MPVTDGGITYGCTNELERQAEGIAVAGRDLANVLKSGGTLPAKYTIRGVIYDVKKINGLTANGKTNNQAALSNAISASRNGTKTLLVLPPATDYYRYSGVLTLSENTYVVGYGAKVMGLTGANIAWYLADNSGVFGYRSHTVDEAMTRWPERHENNSSVEGAKDGNAAKSEPRGWDEAHVVMAAKSNCIMMDVDTRGSFEGALRCTSNNVLVDNCSSYRSHSDAFHLIKQCKNATARNLDISHSGDDAVSMIQYDDSSGGQRPSNILVEDCRLHGSRARGFTAVSAKDVLFLRCVAERVNLAPFMAATTNAHSMGNCEGIKFVECEAWRPARVQSPAASSAGFLALFTAGGHSLGVSGIEVRNCKARWYGNDFYKTGIRQSATAGSISIAVNTGNDFAALTSAD